MSGGLSFLSVNEYLKNNIIVIAVIKEANDNEHIDSFCILGFSLQSKIHV